MLIAPLLAAALLAAPLLPPAAVPFERARPVAALSSYIADSDYPRAAIDAREQGTTRLILDIGADGRVAGCEITRSSGSDLLDGTTCRLLTERARFTPARDTHGRAVPDAMSTLVNWVLPPMASREQIVAANRAWSFCLRPHAVRQFGNAARSSADIAASAFPACRREEDALVEVDFMNVPRDTPEGKAAEAEYRREKHAAAVDLIEFHRRRAASGEKPLLWDKARAELARYVSNDDYPDEAIEAGQQGNVRFTLGVGADGRVTRCAILESSGSPSLDAATCRVMAERARFVPAIDFEGKPAPDSVTSSLRWVLPEDEPEEASPEVEAALNAWMACLTPRLAPHFEDTARTSREIAEAAFPHCRAQEEQVHAPLRAQFAAEPPSVAEEAIGAMRELIVELIEKERKPPRR
jgi:TonB family protein